MDKAIAIFYAALSQMNPSDDFLAARLLTEANALVLYDAATVDSVSKAWEAVGVLP